MSISNAVCPVGIAQQAAVAALEADDDSIRVCSATWQARHDGLVRALRPHFDVIPAHGGWSLLIDFHGRGLTGAEASQRLLAQGVAATSMENWGLDETSGFLRLVYANEPVERLQDIAQRFERAFAA